MLTRFFLKRPRFVQIIAPGHIFITGGLCLPLLPTLEYPDISPPQIVVKTIYMGATSDQVESAVATPLELEINGVENMKYMSSLSDGANLLSLPC